MAWVLSADNYRWNFIPTIFYTGMCWVQEEVRLGPSLKLGCYSPNKECTNWIYIPNEKEDPKQSCWATKIRWGCSIIFSILLAKALETILQSEQRQKTPAHWSFPFEGNTVRLSQRQLRQRLLLLLSKTISKSYLKIDHILCSSLQEGHQHQGSSQ